jgi:hypothetical protein
MNDGFGWSMNNPVPVRLAEKIGIKSLKFLPAFLIVEPGMDLC